MNSYTRTMAAIQGEKYDRTPVIPLIIQNALHIAKIPHSMYSSNGPKMAEAQIYALREYGYDSVYISSDNQIISEVLGCKIELPYDEPPRYISRILGLNTDLNKLNKWFDPYNDGRMPVIIEATKIARAYLKDNYFVKVNCDSGPFSIAAALRGEESFFMDLYDDEQFIYDLLEICSDAVVRYAKAIASSGAHAIAFGDSTSGLVGRGMYEKFALPFQKHIVSQIRNATGLPVFMHICGDTSEIIDLMALSGADVIEIDYMTDMPTAYEKTKHSICIEGNIHPTVVLLQGTSEDVYYEAQKCIRQSGGKNLLLSGGCEIPRLTPRENIKALVQAANDVII